MDMRTSERDVVYSPNDVLRDLRTTRGWGRPRLARELHNYCLRQDWPSPGQPNMEKQIYRLETGRVRSPDDFYKRLYCQFFDRSPHELFGQLDLEGIDPARTYVIRSHKFVPSYIGAAGADRLKARAELDEQQEDRANCTKITSDTHPDLYVWPCGVVIFHVVENLSPLGIAEVAVWRRQTYPADIERASAWLTSYECPPQSEPYVLSAYWVEQTPVDPAQRGCALRMLAIPRVLTSRDMAQADHDSKLHHAAVIEQALLREGFDHPEIVDFGVRGISAAFASWSGVVYHATAPERAITEEELVSCELSIQAAWSYSDYIRAEVEADRDPVVADSCGWRYLRGVRSRLTTERPQETSQHRAMREAIVSTSGLMRRLDQALDALKECDRRSPE